ncbi:MAG: leucine--tRNA ligase, partial [Clostridia bacterium]|nr:leucine--tRNA ligase [Clostridia bacterium]
MSVEKKAAGEYRPAEIEKKWQDIWEEKHAFEASRDYTKKKFYGLIEFPYPSGNGLHVGHPRSNTAMDVISRKRRMEGYNVLFPIGWDAFGLPAENYAIKNHVHPAKVTADNIARFTRQLKMLGFSFDWTREVNTTDPNYYHWTQWIFLQLFKKGLAYKAEMPINWCTSCKVGLANEEVVNGVCERCGGEVVRKVKSQWMLRITDYAQKLLDGLEGVDFIEKVKTQQRNWIGRSEGAEVDFYLPALGEKLTVYTTRPDTLFGATYMVVSPEHAVVERLKPYITNYAEVEAYKAEAARKSDFERTELAKDKTGVPLEGVKAINPVNGTEIPVWISDYVLSSYGTGAIMAVPAHDDRDWAFAKKFGLPIIEVVAGGNVQEAAFTDIQTGTMVNSGFLNGLSVAEAKKAIIDWLSEQGKGVRKVNFKLRD